MEKMNLAGKSLSKEAQKKILGGGEAMGIRCTVVITGGSNQGDWQYNTVAGTCSEALAEAGDFGNAQTANGTDGCIDILRCDGCA